MKILSWLLIGLLFISQHALANGKACSLVFGSPFGSELASEKVNWRSTLTKLDDLGPVALDTPTLKKGLENFWREMRTMNKGFSQFDKIRSDYEKGNLTKDQARQMVEELASHSAKSAESALSKNQADTPNGRKRLEAHRTLLKSLSTFDQHLNAGAPKSEVQKRREELQRKQEEKKRAEQKEKQQQQQDHENKENQKSSDQEHGSDQDQQSSEQQKQKNQQNQKQNSQQKQQNSQKDKSEEPDSSSEKENGDQSDADQQQQDQQNQKNQKSSQQQQQKKKNHKNSKQNQEQGSDKEQQSSDQEQNDQHDQNSQDQQQGPQQKNKQQSQQRSKKDQQGPQSQQQQKSQDQEHSDPNDQNSQDQQQSAQQKQDNQKGQKSQQQQGQKNNQNSQQKHDEQSQQDQNSSEQKDGSEKSQQSSEQQQKNKQQNQQGSKKDQKGSQSQQQQKSQEQKPSSDKQDGQESSEQQSQKDQQGSQQDKKGSQPQQQKNNSQKSQQQDSKGQQKKSSDKQDGQQQGSQKSQEQQSGQNPGEQGQGKPSGEQGQGKPSGEQGQGKPSGEQGQGKPSGEQGQGKPSGEQGQGKPSGEQGQGKPSGEQGQGKPSGEQGQGKPSGEQGQQGKQEQSGDNKQSQNSDRKHENGQNQGKQQQNKSDDGQEGDRKKSEGGAEESKSDSGGKGAGSNNAKREQSESLLDSLRSKFREKFDSEPKTKKNKNKKEKEKLPEKKRKSFFDRDPEEKFRERPKINKVVENHALQKAMLKSLLIQTLREYASSERVLFGLKEFRTVAQSLKGLGNDVAETYLNNAVRLQGELESLSIVIKDLNQLTADIQISLKEGDGQLLAKLHFLEKVLTALSKETPLTMTEERTLDNIRKIIAKTNSQAPATDEELVTQLMRQMPGPLGREFIKNQYRSGETIDYARAAQDIRGDKLNGLTMLSQLKRATQFRSFTRPIPAQRYVYEGSKLPVDDIDPNLEVAEDLTYIKNIHRDGPMQNDIARLAAGDLMERTYRERQAVRGQKSPKENELYIMLYDMSGSMKDRDKYIFQAAAMGATVDAAQLKVIQGNKVSFIAIPFQDSPGQATKIANPKQAAEFFSNMIQTPPFAGGGTNINNALSRAFELIKNAQAEGGDLSRAHILIFTDGNDNVNAEMLQQKKAEVSQKTAVSVHALSMGEGNKNLEDIAKAGLTAGQGSRSSYQYFSYEQMAQMMSATTNRDNVEASSRARRTSDMREVTDADVRDLTRSVVEMRNHLEAHLDPSSNMEITALVRALKKTGPEDLSEMKENVEMLVSQTLAADDSKYKRQGMRSAMTLTFFDTIAKENKISMDDLLALLSQTERQQVLQWIDQ